jgi:DNA-binding NtrC family response regulator
MRTVLVIDDNPAVVTALRVLFRLHDIHVLAALTPQHGLELLARGDADLLIADMNFSADTTSGTEGVSLFRTVKAAYPRLPVILFTAWTNLESAVQLIKAGAADYIAKPWNNDKLVATVKELLELSELTREKARVEEAREIRLRHLRRRYNLGNLVFRSELMERAVELACRVAGAPVPVLLTGPNGVGKDLFANVIHSNSAVCSGPFVTINCGALPSELIEAELFGADAGAYTGAHRTRVGRFELANNGSLFLDEIGELPLSGQVKLLRVLETGQYEPLGTGQTQSTNTRIISATNVDLPAMIREGRFREDLYYRLNLIQIALAPLVDRMDDVPPLAEHFLGKDLQLSEDAHAALLRHDWPGNVRELRNSIERAKLLANGRVVREADLSLPLPRAPSLEEGFAGGDRDDLTREAIEASLREARGNISRAAQRLRMSRQALYRRMERFGLKP